MNDNYFDSMCHGDRAHDRNMQDRVRYDNGTNCYGNNDINMTHCHHTHHTHHHTTGNDNTLWLVLLAALFIICNCCD